MGSQGHEQAYTYARGPNAPLNVLEGLSDVGNVVVGSSKMKGSGDLYWDACAGLRLHSFL